MRIEVGKRDLSPLVFAGATIAEWLNNTQLKSGVNEKLQIEFFR